jgi:hypothetical protein
VPHLSARETIYMLPTTQHADYILFDASPSADFWPAISRDARHEASRALAPHLVSGEYGVVRFEDWVLLLKRGEETQSNPAALRLLFSAKFEAEGLSSDFNSSQSPDIQASDGSARVVDRSTSHAEGKNAAIYGPYASLLPGRYRVSYRLKLDTPSSRRGPLASVDVFSTALGGALAGQEVLVEDFIAPGQYQDFVFDLEIGKPLDDVEYRVLYDGPERLWVDAVEVTPLNVTVPIAAYSGGELSSTAVGLIPGRYRAVYALRLAKEDLTGPVGSIEVYSRAAGGPLASLDIEASAFRDPGTAQDFALDFETTRSWPDIQFRILPSGNGMVEADSVGLSYVLQ